MKNSRACNGDLRRMLQIMGVVENRQLFSEVFEAHKEYTKQELYADNNVMRGLERDVLLRVVDNKWIDHLHNIDMLRDGIGLRAYGQKDPLIEYKREAYDMYNTMMHEVQGETVRYLFRTKFGVQFVNSEG